MKFLILALFAVKVIAEYPPPPTDNPLIKEKNITDRNKWPQFVMLSFDDGVNILNWNDTYQHLYKYENKGGCPISATFFVSHLNCDYYLVHDLWKHGHEIAIHSITHRSPSDFWKTDNETIWTEEIEGQRKIISTYAKIPPDQILGFRAPYLQTGGDATFKVIEKLGLKYDCSMPTQAYSEEESIAFPYSMSHGFAQDCVIEPCPPEKSKGYGDIWEVPLVDYYRDRDVGGEKTPFPCSMIDMCLPFPNTTEDTLKFFKDNFDRHYKNNKAPFPVFMHEAWFRNDAKFNKRPGYYKFIEYLLTLPDVYIVSIQEVLRWMQNPEPIGVYKPKCTAKPTDNICGPKSHMCKLQHTHLGPSCPDCEMIMHICGSRCPTKYPWVDNWKTVVH